MSALILLSPQIRAASYLKLSREQLDKCRVDRRYQYVELPVLEVEGVAEDGFVKANSRVVFRTFPFEVNKYAALIQPNPMLMARGTVQCPMLLVSGEGAGFEVHFTANKRLDPKELEYLIRVSFID